MALRFEWERTIRAFNARQPPDAKSDTEIDRARGVPPIERRTGVVHRLRIRRGKDGVGSTMDYPTIPDPIVVPFPEGTDHDAAHFNSDNRAPEPEWADGGEVTMRAGFDRDGNVYAEIEAHDKGILAPTPSEMANALAITDMTVSLDEGVTFFGRNPNGSIWRERLPPFGADTYGGYVNDDFELVAIDPDEKDGSHGR